MTALVRCPLCGGNEGYRAHKTSLFARLNCAGCHVRVVVAWLDCDYDAAWNAAGAHAQSLRDRVAVLETLLRQYRDDVPRGNQPHMLAHQVDEILEQKP